MPAPRIPIPREPLEALCRRWRIRRLSLFGSVLGDGFRPDSDVDVLVDFELGATPSLFALEQLREELSTLFLGHEVDLFTRASLKPRLADSILASAEEQYAA
jgi:predicted nucleotidyltransferase